MSVHRRGSKWAAKVSITGTRKALWVGTYDTKRDALAAEREAKAKLVLHPPKPRASLTLPEAIRGWKGSLYHTLRRSTREDYDKASGHLIAHFGDVLIGEVKKADAVAFVADFGKTHAPSYVHKVMLRFENVMDWAVENEHLERSPLEGVRKPSQAPLREHRVLSQEELHRLIECTTAYWRPCVMAFAYLGLRRGECFGVTWRNLMPDGVLRVTHQLDSRTRELVPLKTRNASRLVPVPPCLMDVLASHRETCPHSPLDLMFTTPSGTPVHTSNFTRKVFQPAVAAAGLQPLTMHCLRANWGSWAASFLAPADLASVMGHSNPAVSYRLYTRALRKDDALVARLIQETLGTPVLVEK